MVATRGSIQPSELTSVLKSLSSDVPLTVWSDCVEDRGDSASETLDCSDIESLTEQVTSSESENSKSRLCTLSVHLGLAALAAMKAWLNLTHRQSEFQWCSSISPPQPPPPPGCTSSDTRGVLGRGKRCFTLRYREKRYCPEPPIYLLFLCLGYPCDWAPSATPS